MEGRFLFTILLASFSGLSLAQSDNPCAGKYFGEIVADPYRCYGYLVCVLTNPYERTCADGTVFNPSTRRCVDGNQETCEIYGTETTTEEPETEPETTTEVPTEPPTTPTVSTTTRSSTTLPTTTRSTSTRSRTTRTTTTRTTTTRTTTETPTEAPTRPPTLNEICEDVFFGARPFELNSSLYVGCIRGSGIVFRCYSNEFFDSKVNECVKVAEE